MISDLELQYLLCAAGQPVVEDGQAGPLTAAALLALLRRSSPGLSLSELAVAGRLPYQLQRGTWRVTSPFGARRNPFNGAQQHHPGIDLGLPLGASVRAARAGQVIRAEEAGGYGLCVEIAHPDRPGESTLYAHLSILRASKGQAVAAGQVIGEAGSTGASTAAHLHFEVRRAGIGIDPAELVQVVR